MQGDGGSGGGEDPLRRCYLEWIACQAADLSELKLTLALFSTATPDTDDAPLRAAVARSLQFYEDYAQQRRALLREDARHSLDLVRAPWCNSFECAFMWLGGCRPSSALRLTYSISGSELEARLFDLLAGSGRGAAAFVLTARQLDLVDALHHRTVTKEDELTTVMATLQEDVANEPLLSAVRDLHSPREHGSPTEDATEAMVRYEVALARLIETADNLRVSTARELLMEILRPAQAIELIVAAKELHLNLRVVGRRG